MCFGCSTNCVYLNYYLPRVAPISASETNTGGKCNSESFALTKVIQQVLHISVWKQCSSKDKQEEAEGEGFIERGDALFHWMSLKSVCHRWQEPCTTPNFYVISWAAYVLAKILLISAQLDSYDADCRTGLTVTGLYSKGTIMFVQAGLISLFLKQYSVEPQLFMIIFVSFKPFQWPLWGFWSLTLL